MQSMPQAKPKSAVSLKLGNIPKSIKQYERWILWKYSQLPNGKWTKTPHSVSSGHKIDATNMDNGASFADAVKALRGNRERFDGLGFLLGEGIAGIDVDDCIDENGNLDDRGQRMSAAYAGTYAEVSPSGRGFKILVEIGDDPKLASIGKNSGGIEIYGGRRYFTVTGAALPGHAPHIASMADAFERTAREMGVDKAAGSVYDITQEKERSGFDLATARQLLDHLPFSWCDEYGDWLRAGMALHHEFDGDPDALELWDEWSQRNPHKYEEGTCASKWTTFGRPGKDDVTIRTLVREAQSRGWRAPQAIQRAVEDFGALDDPSPMNPETGEIAVGDWWSQHSVGPMLQVTPEPMRWLWKGLLLESKVMLLAGSGGSSKSYLMLAAALQYSLGNQWGPFDLDPSHGEGRVLLLYGEEDYLDVHHRVHSLQHAFMLTDEQVQQVARRMAVLPLRGKDVRLAEYDEGGYAIIITEAARKLEERIRQFNVRLLVLDPMALLHGLEENDNNAMGHFVRQLDAVCMRTGCSIILIHHFSKAVQRAREINEANVRGASALVAHARTVAVMHRLRRDEAAEWGVPEEEHSRWTMFNIVKNNYGPTGAVHWFNVNQANGVITPSETQLTFMNSRDIRMAALAAVQQDQHEQDEELTSAAERRAQEEAERAIYHNNTMRIILDAADKHDHGHVSTFTAARELIEHAMPARTHAKNIGRVTIEALRERGFIEGVGSRVSPATITATGREWLEGQRLLAE
jgi:RecA-family ATPase